MAKVTMKEIEKQFGKGSQAVVVMRMLQKGPVTSMAAFSEHSITRLAAVVFELRGAGVNIVTKRKVQKNVFGAKHYGEYVLQ